MRPPGRSTCTWKPPSPSPEFTDGAVRRIAEKALKRDTGARGLRAIVEEIMLDIMYELPEQPRGSNYVVTEEVVDSREKLFPVPEAKHKSA